jgi:hypothetical protein
LLLGIGQHGDLGIGVGDVELPALQAVQALQNDGRARRRIGIGSIGNTCLRARLAQACGGVGIVGDRPVGEASDIAVGRSGQGKLAGADLEVVHLLGIADKAGIRQKIGREGPRHSHGRKGGQRCQQQ